jgi:uncharacterized protein (TIGR02118 family)
MIKRFVILRRKPNLNVAEFRNYWQNIHAHLVAKVPGIIKYIQYHVHDEHLDGFDDPIDGIAELWFASEEAMRNAYQSKEYQEVMRDADNFIMRTGHYLHPVIADQIIQVI